MIEDLLPSPTEVAESFGDAPVESLFPAEAEIVARAVPVRRHEYATVRVCAREALGRLGIPPAPLLPGASGEPLWPAGIVGSMTHCRGYRAAAVARSTDVTTIGLDAEPNQPLPSTGVLDHVARPEEQRLLARLAEKRPDVCWDRLLFSAKESIYKAWFPLAGRWLDFLEATVVINPDEGTFSSRLLVPGPLVDGVRVHGFRGGWLVRNGLVLTAITLTRADSGAGADAATARTVAAPATPPHTGPGPLEHPAGTAP
ncbi:4'-phosphopantetheinyl transferase [Streptomyces sp. NBC_01306]|uniref:4'-phosphopantetheinyl transferase family protein n=1 Tax=Streptomyces sp. NBC_01306 TaxID=2903819 RepID=UPI00225624E8|nr:4'-phosphopantetheinyl transferase superfamily protein [Streptomyces sp. NBC_01306]MCX4723215.1 4'-phosphopantetheinyl transferase superfamily protein [Streptomyces sp. NBC_01306]